MDKKSEKRVFHPYLPIEITGLSDKEIKKLEAEYKKQKQKTNT